MTEQIITKKSLNKLFDYNDGEIYWKVRLSNRTKIGDKAGNPRTDGYLRISIGGKDYAVHRLIFLMHYGYLPKELDHIDNDKLNNKVENLREATRNENLYNRKTGKSNSSGIKNVSWSKGKSKWNVLFSINGKNKHLGYYKDLELAELVAIEAREKFHGNFANNG